MFSDLDKLTKHIEKAESEAKYRSCILQKYITNPLLINSRKFDIRVFALLVAHAETGLIRGYFYEEGYLRTSCKEFSLQNLESRFVHLTNDAVQKNCTSYGAFE